MNCVKESGDAIVILLTASGWRDQCQLLYHNWWNCR